MTTATTTATEMAEETDNDPGPLPSSGIGPRAGGERRDHRQDKADDDENQLRQ